MSFSSFRHSPLARTRRPRPTLWPVALGAILALTLTTPLAAQRLAILRAGPAPSRSAPTFTPPASGDRLVPGSTYRTTDTVLVRPAVTQEEARGYSITIGVVGTVATLGSGGAMMVPSLSALPSLFVPPPSVLPGASRPQLAAQP